jgi:hypothetical protein
LIGRVRRCRRLSLGARIRRHAPRLLSLGVHELGAECALRPELVVGPASKPHLLRRRTASARYFVDVIEFEKRARRTTVTGRADVRALPTISLPHGAFDVRRDVALACGRGAPAWTRLGGLGELPPLELHDERIERSFEYLRDIVQRDLMTQQRLGVAQLIVRALPDGDLKRESLGRDRRHS